MALTKTPIAMLDATGTAGAGNFLRGDGSWSSSVPTSMVRWNTANGYGSTNTRIRRFVNSVTNIGSDITATDSATLGASFTINTSGIYSISYSDNFNTSAHFCLSLNASIPTSPLTGAPVSEVLVGATTSQANFASNASWTGYLASGSVIRAHGDGSPVGTTTNYV